MTADIKFQSSDGTNIANVNLGRGLVGQSALPVSFRLTNMGDKMATAVNVEVVPNTLVNNTMGTPVLAANAESGAVVATYALAFSHMGNWRVAVDGGTPIQIVADGTTSNTQVIPNVGLVFSATLNASDTATVQVLDGSQYVYIAADSGDSPGVWDDQVALGDIIPHNSPITFDVTEVDVSTRISNVSTIPIIPMASWAVTGNPNEYAATSGGQTYTVNSNSAYPAEVRSLFNGIPGGDANQMLWDGNSNMWFTLALPTAIAVGGYSLRSRTGGFLQQSPNTFRLEGSATGAFAGEEVIIDTRAGQTAWGEGERRTYTLTAPAITAYQYYRFYIVSNDGWGAHTTMSEFELHERVGTEKVISRNLVPKNYYVSIGQPEVPITSSAGIDNPHLLYDDFWGGRYSRFYSANFPSWVKADLTRQVKVVKYSLISHVTTYPASWRLEGSNDNVAWTIVDARPGNVNPIQLTQIWGDHNKYIFNVQNPGAYRYYRLVMASVPAGRTFCDIHCFEMFEEVAPIVDGIFKNLIPEMKSDDSPHGLASTSNSYNNTEYLPWKAFNRRDGDEPNIWATNAVGAQWLQYEFETPQVATRYALTVRNGRHGQDPAQFNLSASNDQQNWIQLDARTGQAWGASERRQWDFANTTAYKYYRLNILASTGAGNYSLAKFEIWGVERKEFNYSAVVELTDGSFVNEVRDSITATDPQTIHRMNWSVPFSGAKSIKFYASEKKFNEKIFADLPPNSSSYDARRYLHWMQYGTIHEQESLEWYCNFQEWDTPDDRATYHCFGDMKVTSRNTQFRNAINLWNPVSPYCENVRNWIANSKVFQLPQGSIQFLTQFHQTYGGQAIFTIGNKMANSSTGAMMIYLDGNRKLVPSIYINSANVTASYPYTQGAYQINNLQNYLVTVNWGPGGFQIYYDDNLMLSIPTIESLNWLQKDWDERTWFLLGRNDYDGDTYGYFYVDELAAYSNRKGVADIQAKIARFNARANMPTVTSGNQKKLWVKSDLPPGSILAIGPKNFRLRISGNSL